MRTHSSMCAKLVSTATGLLVLLSPTASSAQQRDRQATPPESVLVSLSVRHRDSLVRPPIQGESGTRVRPIVGLKRQSGLGFTPQLGLTRTSRDPSYEPYRSKERLKVAYSTTLRDLQVDLETDNRFPDSRLLITSKSRWTGIGVGHFRGFGNDMPELTGPFYRARQHQWSFAPAIGFAFGPESHISLGPVVKQTTTDSADTFISEVQPYGFGRFGQAGGRLAVEYDSWDRFGTVSQAAEDSANRRLRSGGFVTEIEGAVYPEMWDVASTFSTLSVTAVKYIGIRLPGEPVLALRAGAAKVWGEFPYFEAAFLGGSHTLRGFRHQRFAGDAAVHGSAEVRVPVARFKWWVPLNVGLLGIYDIGRVYLDGESPGGWHTTAGGGLWFGAFSPGSHVHVLFTDSRERRMRFGLGFDY